MADPGARLVAAAHAQGMRVVPLVGPSSLLLALMASGMNGQSFAFHGYLPVPPDARAAALRRLEEESRTLRRAQLFIETPYRNEAMLKSIGEVLRPATTVCVAADLTLASETIERRTAAAWATRGHRAVREAAGDLHPGGVTSCRAARRARARADRRARARYDASASGQSLM